MDQVTCALGRENELLVLKCQPHDLLGFVRIPSCWEFIGLDSGVKHSVGGSNYTRARVGAFMGLQIVRQLVASRALQSSATSSGPLVDGPVHLCSFSRGDWLDLRGSIPERLSG